MSRSALKFTVSKEGRTTLVRLDGPHIVDQMYIARLGEELLTALEEAEPPDLLIDLGEVETLSSSVLGKLIQLLKRARQLHGRVRLCSVQPYVRKIFRITQLDGVFEIHDTAEDALSNEQDGPPQSSDEAAQESPPTEHLPV
jgi:anti-sigma B factor antagonist